MTANQINQRGSVRKYADKKRNGIDEILTNQLNKPFIVQHTNWFTFTLSVIGSIVLLMLCFNFCKWFGCFNLIRRFCCFTRNPRNGEIVPPMIKNFVNCSFGSNHHSDYHNPTRQVVLYDVEKESLQMEPLLHLILLLRHPNKNTSGLNPDVAQHQCDSKSSNTNPWISGKESLLQSRRIVSSTRL
ncbi:hypothetical protein QE152_g30075 [Popillia japonica]|uniref:Uncharacterized protein n=1 Tax=Popillia japonica TaxID=7064 RepID=A0AAW1JFW6_POPJA